MQKVRQLLNNLQDRLKSKAAKTVLYSLKIKDRPNLSRLSEKKRVAFDCLIDGIDNVDMDPMVKENWIGWFYYAMRMISDEQVDALAWSMQESNNDYLMYYFTNELNKGKKPKLPYWKARKFNDEKLTLTQDFKAYYM